METSTINGDFPVRKLVNTGDPGEALDVVEPWMQATEMEHLLPLKKL